MSGDTNFVLQTKIKQFFGGLKTAKEVLFSKEFDSEEERTAALAKLGYSGSKVVGDMITYQLKPTEANGALAGLEAGDYFLETGLAAPGIIVPTTLQDDVTAVLGKDIAFYLSESFGNKMQHILDPDSVALFEKKFTGKSREQ